MEFVFLDIRLHLEGEESLEVAEVDLSLGFTYQKTGRQDRAYDCYLKAYNVRKAILGHSDPDTQEALLVDYSEYRV